MNKKIILPFLVGILLFSASGKSQVSVVNIQVIPYNITPEVMLSASVMNNGNDLKVELVSRLYNFNNELLLTVKSAPFNLKKGLNSAIDVSRKATSVEYYSGNQSDYLKTTHALPNGTFKICVDVIQAQNPESLDQFCDEIESDYNQFLYLVFPADKDMVESTTPVLMWTHNEPFSVLTQGEYYRIIVTEIKEKQNAQEAIDINTPLMAKNYVTNHNVQYPYDAPVLQKGKHYAWQIQKVANGVTTNKTEAWEFSVSPDHSIKENKYVSLRKTLDAGYYLAENNKVFFKFDAQYSSGIISCKIYDDKRNVMEPKAMNIGAKNPVPNFRQTGDNRYEINLNELNIKKGYYTLEVKNEKEELYLLKFYVE
jgi:hypothetical protein